MQIRMLSPADTGPLAVVRQNPVNVNGRIYTPSVGAVFDVPDFDAGQLAANGWVRIAPSGATSERPASTALTPPYTAGVGTLFFDQGLNALIVFDGQAWKSPATGESV